MSNWRIAGLILESKFEFSWDQQSLLRSRVYFEPLKWKLPFCTDKLISTHIEQSLRQSYSVAWDPVTDLPFWSLTISTH